MTPQDAIEAAELAEAESRYRNQVAREMYQAGQRAGFDAGVRHADAEMAAQWHDLTGAVADGLRHAELEERRWGPGGPEHFADPRPGDFPGRTTPEPEIELEAG